MPQIAEDSPLRDSLTHHYNELGRQLDDAAQLIANSYDVAASAYGRWKRVRAEYEEVRSLLYGGGIFPGPFLDDPMKEVNDGLLP